MIMSLKEVGLSFREQTILIVFLIHCFNSHVRLCFLNYNDIVIWTTVLVLLYVSSIVWYFIILQLLINISFPASILYDCCNDWYLVIVPMCWQPIQNCKLNKILLKANSNFYDQQNLLIKILGENFRVQYLKTVYKNQYSDSFWESNS